MIICGASFAGLTIARELTGSGARVLVLDRYEIGERQTSACAAPTRWLEALGLMTSVRQTFDDLVFHTPHADTRMRLPWSFSTFDYPELCGLLWAGTDAEFETAKVEGRGDAAAGRERITAPIAVETDRGTSRRRWSSMPSAGAASSATAISRPTRRSRAASRFIPAEPAEDLELWIERDVVPAGYGWSFPAGDELRVGVGSFDPRHHVKDPTVELADRPRPPPRRLSGQLDPAQAPRRGRPRRLLLRRLRRPLPAGDGRGDRPTPNRGQDPQPAPRAERCYSSDCLLFTPYAVHPYLPDVSPDRDR